LFYVSTYVTLGAKQGFLYFYGIYISGRLILYTQECLNVLSTDSLLNIQNAHKRVF
jgi:hypothetical protein